MQLRVRPTDLTIAEPMVFMSSDDCLKLGVGPEDRVSVTCRDTVISAVSVLDGVISEGTVLIPLSLMYRCGVSEGSTIEVLYSPAPESIRSIRKKINGCKLDSEEIGSIINDIVLGNLSDKEIIAFVSAFNINNADMDEIAMLTRSMAETGRFMDFGDGPKYDFHSLGGVSGNKITPIVVSILASQGVMIPKLSSRAVSSACGTSDYVDTFCDVELNEEDMRKAVKTTNGLFACGNEDIAPVGKAIIDAERPLGIDPRPMMMASIMSKKVALGITHLLIDIPMGKDSKIPDMETAEGFAEGFIELGKRLGMTVQCAVSNAEQPIGRTVGPILEARECISILEEGTGDPSVVDKACGMGGMLLEMAGFENGEALAHSILSSGEAHSRFLDIVEAQNGDRGLRSSDLNPGAFSKDVHAKRDGFVQYIDNECIAAIAKGAGAPLDLGAGIVLRHKVGDRVSEGEVLFTVFAENQAKLDRSIDSARSRRPMHVGPIMPFEKEMIIRHIR